MGWAERAGWDGTAAGRSVSTSNPSKPRTGGWDPYRRGDFLRGFLDSGKRARRRRAEDGTRLTRRSEGARVAVSRRRNRAARASRRRQRV